MINLYIRLVNRLVSFVLDRRVLYLSCWSRGCNRCKCTPFQKKNKKIHYKLVPSSEKTPWPVAGHWCNRIHAHSMHRPEVSRTTPLRHHCSIYSNLKYYLKAVLRATGTVPVKCNIVTFGENWLHARSMLALLNAMLNNAMLALIPD